MHVLHVQETEKKVPGKGRERGRENICGGDERVGEGGTGERGMTVNKEKV